MFKQRSPTKQDQYSLDYLEYLSKIACKAELEYRQSMTPKEKDSGSKWSGKWIDLVPAPSKSPKHHGGLSTRSKTTDISATGTTDSVGDEVPDCGVSSKSLGKIKWPQFPEPSASSSSAMQEDPVRSVSVHDLYTDVDADADAQLSTGQEKRAGKKKHAAGPKKSKNPAVKGRVVKSHSGVVAHGASRGKKQEAGAENKKPRHLRKAKDRANDQMKLEFADERTSGCQDFFEDDVYMFENTRSPEFTRTYKGSRQGKKMTSPVACYLRLAQRVQSSLGHGQMRDQLPSNYPPSTCCPPSLSSRSVIQKSAQLFDAMMKQESQAAPKDHSIQSASVGGAGRRSFQLTEAAAEKELEAVPR